MQEHKGEDRPVSGGEGSLLLEFQLLCLVGDPKRSDEFYKVTVQNVFKPMQREFDSVVGDTALGIVVGTNLRAPVTRTNLRPSVLRCLLLLLLNGLVQ